MLSESWIIVIARRVIFLAKLDVPDGITSGINAVEPEWGDYAYPEACDELEGIPWDVVVSSQNLIWSEGSNVVVGVSLNLEENFWRNRVPWMNLANRLVDTVLILHPHDSIMFNIVATNSEEVAPPCIHELPLKTLQAESFVYYSTHNNFNDFLVSHFVKADNC